jgi:hypothetical protein
MTIEDIAQICHEANKGVCAISGDKSQLPWENAHPWQKESAVKGVEFAIANPDASAEDQHNAWCAHKKKDGWVYGSMKNEALKFHPCLVSYEELPASQRAKDIVFKAIVNSLKQFVS